MVVKTTIVFHIDSKIYRKRDYVKKPAAIFFALVLAVIMCGCCAKHNFSPATCTTAATCTKCGETNGSALGHNFSEATCTEAGICRRCGATQGSALGHSWTDATCTEAKTCSVCGTVSDSNFCPHCGAPMGK